MSDEELRSRLSELADGAAPRLDPAARLRVLDVVEREGPTVQRRGRMLRVAAVVVPLAAAALLVVGLRGALDEWAEPVAEGPTAPACHRWSPLEATPRRGLLRLGRRGEVRIDGELTLAASNGCTTELELTRGRASVHARDLGGGTLRVLAGEVVVEVRGTRFSVIREESDVEVSVTEGHVVVQAPGEREIHLRGGERWSRGDRTASSGASNGATPPVEASSIAAIAAAASEVASDNSAAPRAARRRRAAADTASGLSGTEPPVPTDRLREAEVAWRAGEHDRARRLFREVGAGTGTTAEVAWVRLARHELEVRRLREARAALTAQRRRFPRSRFGPEVLWLQADVARRLGDAADRARALEELRERYPDSPQAASASNLEGTAAP